MILHELYYAKYAFFLNYLKSTFLGIISDDSEQFFWDLGKFDDVSCKSRIFLKMNFWF